MRIGFVDESISDGHHFMGAISIAPSTCALLSRAIEDMLNFAHNSHNVDLKLVKEVHAKELWRGKGPWERISERDRFGMIQGLIQDIANIDFDLFFIGINKEKMAQRYSEPVPPHELALKFLLEALDRKLELAGDHALVVCDEIGSSTEQNRYREQLREYRKFGTSGSIPRKLNQIADTLHFVPSEQSYGIQTIDILTFTHRRRIVNSHPSSAEKNVMTSMRSLVLPHIVSDRIWP